MPSMVIGTVKIHIKIFGKAKVKTNMYIYITYIYIDKSERISHRTYAA